MLSSDSRFSAPRPSAPAPHEGVRGTHGAHRQSARSITCDLCAHLNSMPRTLRAQFEGAPARPLLRHAPPQGTRAASPLISTVQGGPGERTRPRARAWENGAIEHPQKRVCKASALNAALVRFS